VPSPIPVPVVESLIAHTRALGDAPWLSTADGTLSYADLARALEYNTSPNADTLYHGDQPIKDYVLSLLRSAAYGQSLRIGHGPAEDMSQGSLHLSTSGSTGQARWVTHQWSDWWKQYPLRRARHSGAMAWLMAPDHIGGLHTLFYALSRGIHLVRVEPQHTDDLGTAMVQHRIQTLPTTPAHLFGLWQAGFFDRVWPHLRLITYGAEAMAPALRDQIAALQPQVRWKETYGSTEAGILPMASGQQPGVWKPLFPWKLKGQELWVQAPNGAWIATGDRAEALPDDSLRYLGRHQDRIKVGGVLVDPLITLNALRDDSSVLQASVSTPDHPMMGKVLEADLWLHSEVDSLAWEQSTRQRLSALLEAPYRPVRYRFHQNSPMNTRLKSSIPQ